jgi:hypothetical protein
MSDPLRPPEVEQADRKGLIRESYAIEAITGAECRSILLDWALALPVDAQTGPVIGVLLGHYAPLFPDHPMTAILRAGLDAAAPARRRGGRAGRTGPGA